MPPSLPPLSRLHSALEALRAGERPREIVELVEAWAAVAPPSPHASLLAAQALLDLRQVERAWSRLQPLLDEPSPPVQVFETAAEALLARGWHDRARELLSRALAAAPDNAALQHAWDRAAADPQPVPQPPGRDAPLSRAAGLPLAESLLASGQVLSARSLLDRLARTYPQDRRIQDLRWALGTDLRPARSVADLVASALPEHASPEPLQEPENTDAITQERPVASTAAAERPAPTFPPLFRVPSETDGVFDEPDRELTAKSALDFVDLPDPFEERPTEIDAAGDTRILRVIDLKGVRQGPATSPALSPSLPTDGSFDSPLEDEDDDLVVLTHRTWPAPSPPPAFDQDPSLSEVGREVAHLLREPGERRPKAGATPAPTDDLADADASDELELTPIDVDPALPTREPRQHRGSGWATVAWLVVFALILVLGGGVATALAALLLLQS